MRTHTNKTAGQAVKGAGVPALPLIFPRVIADGKNKVRKSLAGRSPSMGELHGCSTELFGSPGNFNNSKRRNLCKIKNSEADQPSPTWSS